LGRSENGKPVSGVGLFLNATQADKRTLITDNQIALGIFWKPPFKSLPDDVLAFAVGRTHVNSRVRHGEVLDPSNPEPQTSEYAAELYYSAHPTHWLEMRPKRPVHPQARWPQRCPRRRRAWPEVWRNFIMPCRPAPMVTNQSYNCA
jgi:carbohydrate-selective porin OprB